MSVRGYSQFFQRVALRKESVDRNYRCWCARYSRYCVALRKESVDRNDAMQIVIVIMYASLSARRAWIEIMGRHEKLI